jgi:hypothetical protein
VPEGGSRMFSLGIEPQEQKLEGIFPWICHRVRGGRRWGVANMLERAPSCRGN